MKSNKTLLWVGIGSALLIGGGLFWWFRKSAKDKEAAALAKEAEDKATQEKEKEIVKKEKVEDNTPTLPSTPFKNKTEGDAFRVWMSSAHPEFRYKNDILGKSGEYNNSFMKEAYSKYKGEYALSFAQGSILPNKDTTKTIGLGGFSLGEKIYLNPKMKEVALYNFPVLLGGKVIGWILRDDFYDKSFGTILAGGTKDNITAKINVPKYRKNKLEPINNNDGSLDAYVSAAQISNSPF